MEQGAAREEIRALLDDMVAAINKGDAALLGSLLSDRADSAHIGSGAEEWWTSAQFAEFIAAVPELVGSGHDWFELDEPKIHVHGDVGWSEAQGRFINKRGDKLPVRTTGVLVREDGQWRVVQSHASVGGTDMEFFA